MARTLFDEAPRRSNPNVPARAGDDPLTSYIGGYARDVGSLMSGGSYSDFVASRNEAMDGWYSTIMESVPVVRNIHGALLGRDQAMDYMSANGLGWKDVQGYNASKLTSPISNNLGGALSTGARYVNNVANDLGKLYSKE